MGTRNNEHSQTQLGSTNETVQRRTCEYYGDLCDNPATHSAEILGNERVALCKSCLEDHVGEGAKHTGRELKPGNKYTTGGGA